LNIAFSPFPELKTERLLLRRLTFEDSHELMWLRSDERVNKYLDRQKSMNIHEAAEFVKKIDKNLEENKSGYWVICLAESRTLIGTICLWNLQPEKDMAELGYELSPMYQGKGIMHEAAEKIIAYAFETMQAKVITALTVPQNEPSRKVLEKCGFKADTKHEYVSAAEADGQTVYFLLNN
jgi:[ribosomal protein S5]-alanine N-acetyltransferase